MRIFKTIHGPHKGQLRMVRQTGGDAIGVYLMGMQAFRLYEHLVLITLGNNNFKVRHKNTLPDGKLPDVIPDVLVHTARAFCKTASEDLQHLISENDQKYVNYRCVP